MNEQAYDASTAMAVAQVWAELEPAAARYLAEPRRRERVRHHRRTVGLAVAAVAIGAGGTAAAARLLIGDAAPPAVQQSIAGVDEGMPADLRLNPDATHARSVAVDGSAVLYAADLPDGGVCTEIALAGRPMGAVCRSGSNHPEPIEATIPGTPEAGDNQIVVAGRIAVPADAARLVTNDGLEIVLSLQPGGFFIVELSGSESDAARRGLQIESEHLGRILASSNLSDAFTPENGRLDPISVEMVSGPGDLTQLLSLSGTVRVKGAVAVRLVYPDGTRLDTPIGATGHYQITLPGDRRGAMARTPGRLVAIDSDGVELASRTVAAVSYWHSNEDTR